MCTAASLRVSYILLMSLKKLSRVRSFPQDVTERLAQNGVLTCKDFLTKTPLELMNTLDYTLPQIQSLTSDVCRAIAPTSKTVLTLARERRGKEFLPTHLSNLDVALHGGLPNGTITEVTGPSGCGKTQFCLLLSVVAALPESVGGRGVRVVYIDTESTFNAERLLEIAKSRYPDHFSTFEHLASLASDVHVFTEFTGASLMKRLEQLEQFVVERNIGLVIVDSIASIVRKEYDTSSKRGVAERASLLARQALRLKYLAEAFKIPVVVTNQITTQLSHDSSDFSQVVESVVTAALGNSWSHCVNTRLSLEYLPGRNRMLTVAKSPLCGQESFIVSIEDKGVVLDWVSTVESREQALQSHGDPSTLSLAVHTDINTGLRVEYPGQLS